MNRISQAVKDRDESLHQVATFKRQNEQLLENTTTLEEKLSSQKKKSRSFEDQLKKLELKVAHSDSNLADQVVHLRIFSSYNMSRLLTYVYWMVYVSD